VGRISTYSTVNFSGAHYFLTAAFSFTVHMIKKGFSTRTKGNFLREKGRLIFGKENLKFPELPQRALGVSVHIRRDKSLLGIEKGAQKSKKRTGVY